MPFVTLHRVPVSHLLAMASGALENTLTDIDFLETLAAKKCFLVPPYVVRAEPGGGLTKITRLVYTADGTLDKPRILVETARQLRRIRQMGAIGRRFTF